MFSDKKSYCRIVGIVALALVPAQFLTTHAKVVTVAWDPSPDSDVVSYALYYAETSSLSINRVEIGNSTVGTLQDLQEGKSYRIYATATNARGFESSLSQGIVFQVPTGGGPSLPRLIEQPVSIAGSLGGLVNLAVRAEGADLSFQWRLNGNPIPGATGSSYSIPALQTGDAGTYDVVVSNSAGSITSSAASLAVASSAPFNNGTFESQFNAWTVSGDPLVVDALGVSGSKAAYFASAGGKILQNFTTAIGQAYELTYQLCAISFHRNEQRLEATLEGAGTIASQTASVIGFDGTIDQWFPQTLRFVANSASTTLSFVNVTQTPAIPDIMLLLLDDVRISEVN